MSKFKRHMNAEGKLELKNASGETDVFTIPPLGFKHLPTLFEIQKKFVPFAKDAVGQGKIEDLSEEKLLESSQKFLDTLDSEMVTSIGEVIMATLKLGYPEEKLDVLEKFGQSNMFELLNVIMEVNLSSDESNDSLKKKLEELKKHDASPAKPEAK